MCTSSLFNILAKLHAKSFGEHLRCWWTQLTWYQQFAFLWKFYGIDTSVVRQKVLPVEVPGTFYAFTEEFFFYFRRTVILSVDDVLDGIHSRWLYHHLNFHAADTLNTLSRRSAMLLGGRPQRSCVTISCVVMYLFNVQGVRTFIGSFAFAHRNPSIVSVWY